jgi:hypothetical protein
MHISTAYMFSMSMLVRTRSSLHVILPVTFLPNLHNQGFVQKVRLRLQWEQSRFTHTIIIIIIIIIIGKDNTSFVLDIYTYIPETNHYYYYYYYYNCIYRT